MKGAKISRRNFIIGGTLVLLTYSYFETNRIAVKTYNFPIRNLPPSYEGFTILHLTDLHSKEFGAGQKDLLNLIKQYNFDIVAITGDLVNKSNPVLKPGLDLIKGFADKSVYFVPGNHEWWSGYHIKEPLLELGVRILENRSERITVNQQHIWLLGVDDPYSGRDNLQEALNETFRDNAPRVLLAHAPEIFGDAVKGKVDLALVGHTHGGQVRLPLVGAVIVPGQGLFPKYDYGIYKEGSTTMLINGGLGESVLPMRFNMSPEIALIKLVSML